MGVVAALSTALWAEERAIIVTVVLPESRAARTYLASIGFYDELDRRGWEPDGDLDVDVEQRVEACLPVTSLSASWEVDQASEILVESLGESAVATNIIQYIETVAVELTENGREHGARCYVVAQSHTGHTSGTAGIHVAIADSGPGFAETLRSFGPLSDAEAILKGFEEGISGTAQPSRGFGLSHVQEAVDVYPGAELWLWSGKGVVLRAGGSFVPATTSRYAGTLATAYFPATPYTPTT